MQVPIGSPKCPVTSLTATRLRNNIEVTRRTLLRRTALLLPAYRFARGQTPEEQQNAILARIKAPVFPKRDFEITRYGAKGDGKTDCTAAIHKAIGACTKSGGGRVIVPSGRFLTGAIHVENNVNLYVAD